MNSISTNMKKALVFLLAFILFTVLIRSVGVKTVVPADVVENEAVSEAEIIDGDPDGETSFSLGFAKLNVKLQHILGYRHSLETLTKLLGYLALLVVAGYGCLGLLQLIRAKSFRGVDPQLLVLGTYYVIVLICYVLFEKIVINCRPVILDEGLEASYPSSHTVLVIAVMATASALAVKYLPWLEGRERVLKTACYALIAVMIVCRLLSGVHWFTDIIGGVLVSLALVFLYRSVCERLFPEGGTTKPETHGNSSGRAKPGKSGRRGGAHLA